MKPSLNPLTVKILGQKPFGLGPKAATGNATEFVRGVVETMNLVHATTRISYRPQTITEDILLASESGYNADRERAIFDALLLADAAIWRFDFLRPVDDTITLSGDATLYRWFFRSLEEALVLNSTVVNKHSFFVQVANVLSLTHNARQTLLVETILDILLLEHNSTFVKDFLRAAEHNLSLTATATQGSTFIKALTDVILFDQSATLTADFIRAATDLLLIVDDAQGSVFVEAILKSLTDLLLMNDEALKSLAFSRDDTRTLNIAQAASGTINAACDRIDYTLIGTTYWPSYQACIQNKAGSTANYTETCNYMGGSSLGTGFGKWRGGVLAPNGYIYCCPYNSTQALKIDPSGNSAAVIGSTHSGSLKWSGGCLGFTDNIITCCPWSATTVLLIDTDDDTTNTIISGLTGGEKYSSAVVNKEGYAYFVPYDSTNIMYVNTANRGDYGEASTGLTGADKFAGGCIAPDGYDLVCIPASKTKVSVFDTSNSINIIAKPEPDEDIGASKWYGCVLTENNYIYAAPFNYGKFLKIDCTDNYSRTTFGTISGTDRYVGCAFAANQKIYCAPFSANAVLVLETNNSDNYYETITTPNLTNKWIGAVTGEDGKVYLPPGRAEYAGVIDTDSVNAPTTNILRSPYFNKSF